METIEVSSETRRWLSTFRSKPDEQLSRTLRRVLELADQKRGIRMRAKAKPSTKEQREKAGASKKELVRDMLLAEPTSLQQIADRLSVKLSAAQSLVGDVSAMGYRNESTLVDGVRFYVTKKP